MTYIITIKIRRKEVSLARIGRLVLATGVVTVVAAGIGTPAHAEHNGWAHWKVTQGSDYAGVGIGKKYIGACDMERDGNGVYAEYQVVGGAGSSRIADGNGSKAGCGVGTHSRNITNFRVCEDDAGRDSCSGWKSVR